MGKRIHRASSAQEILESSMSGRKMRGEYRRLAEMANARLERIRKAGLEASEFYQEHKAGFESEIYGTRRELALELAKLNRFLNAKSSTVSGLREARKDLVDAMNRLYGKVDPLTDKAAGPFDVNNIDKFGKFMKMWRDKYKEQMNLASDKVVDMFIAQERLQLSQGDILRNADYFTQHEKEIESWTVEAIREKRGIKDEKHRFRFSSYKDSLGI